ncbi:MAG: EI24 domain-containing protein [Azospirillaceae bacterium]
MIRSLTLAIEQLGDPAIRRVLWLSIALTLATAVALVVGVAAALGSVDVVAIGWLDTVIDWLGGLAAAVLAIIFFPAVVGIIASLFLETVADAVEARHYPGLGPARGQGVIEALGTALRFFALLVIANLIGLAVVYVIPGINAIVFYAVNGYLLGREYYDLVALRRLTPAAAREARRARGGTVFAAGVVIAVLLSIPIVNLLAPIVATAFMVHIFQRVVIKS